MIYKNRDMESNYEYRSIKTTLSRLKSWRESKYFLEIVNNPTAKLEKPSKIELELQNELKMRKKYKEIKSQRIGKIILVREQDI